MGLWARFLAKLAKKRIRMLPKLYRGQAKFTQCYPHYQIGLGSYGIPVVHDWQEGATLKIGRYTSSRAGGDLSGRPPSQRLGHHLPVPRDG